MEVTHVRPHSHCSAWLYGFGHRGQTRIVHPHAWLGLRVTAQLHQEADG